MRIISGVLGGRQFDSLPGNRTHPMSEKMRGALFNTLGDISGLSVLDAFAGSGALSFEAISRGSAEVTAVEVDKSAHKTIKQNIQKLNLNSSHLLIRAIRANVSGWSDKNSDEQFDLVFCDPPYDKLNLSLLQKLAKHVKPDGLMVLSWPGKLIAPELADLQTIKTQPHGDAQLIYYNKHVKT